MPPTPTVPSYGPPTQQPDHMPRASRENQPITRDEITQIIRQELRQTNQKFNPNQRGPRTHDGKVDDPNGCFVWPTHTTT